MYEVDYAGSGARVAGVGLAAIRDAASAFLHGTDMPVRGRSAYVFGISQSGRFLRQFLHDGFNADERDRRVFDVVWPHIAGRGPGIVQRAIRDARLLVVSRRRASRSPISSSATRRARATASSPPTRPIRLPKVIYTNTSVEYWGQGRAAALTHTTIDGKADATVPDNVRIYLLSGTQHGESAFPPSFGAGQAMGNPTPQANVMRALLRAAHQWAASGVRPPDSRYPRLRDETLVPVDGGSLPDAFPVSAIRA